VTQPRAERRPASAPLILLTGLVALAAVLRFWRLGNWSLDSDEVFMLRDSIEPSITNPRPLLYFLNHWLVQPLVPLDEFGLRLLPAIFGVLAIPVFYAIGRRLVGERAALFGALLLTVSPLHVYYSQFARYWSLVFLLSTVYPYALYLGIRDRSPPWLWLGVATAILAALAHPASVLLLGGLGLWLVVTHIRRERIAQLWSQSRVRWVTPLVAIVLVVASVRMVGLLYGWISEHDTQPGGTEFLLGLPTRPGLKQVLYLIVYAESLTVLLSVTGFLGIYLMWRDRDRRLAQVLTCMLIFPVAFLTLLSFRTPVSTFYLLPTVPAVYLGAGYLLDRLGQVQWGLRPAWLLPALLAVVIFAEGAPTLVSQYRDGRRYDFRGASQYIGERMSADDVIFSDQYKVVAHYLPGKQVRRLRGDPVPLMQTAQVMQQRGGSQNVLWVVTPAASHAFRTNPKLGTLNRWIYDNCQLRTTLGHTRIDFRQNLLQIYRCPPLLPGAAGQPDDSSISSQPRSGPARDLIELPRYSARQRGLE
jgi:mannosyltransferase